MRADTVVTFCYVKKMFWKIEKLHGEFEKEQTNNKGQVNPENFQKLRDWA